MEVFILILCRFGSCIYSAKNVNYLTNKELEYFKQFVYKSCKRFLHTFTSFHLPWVDHPIIIQQLSSRFLCQGRGYGPAAFDTGADFQVSVWPTHICFHPSWIDSCHKDPTIPQFHGHGSCHHVESSFAGTIMVALIVWIECSFNRAHAWWNIDDSRSSAANGEGGVALCFPLQ